MISDELFITCARELTQCPADVVSDRYVLDHVLPNVCDPHAFRAALALAYQAGAASVSGCACGHHHAGKPCDGNGCTCTSYLAVQRA